jgi:hypothetical protein
MTMDIFSVIRITYKYLSWVVLVMLRLLMAVSMGSVLVGGTLVLLWTALHTWGRGVTAAVWFFPRASLLASGTLATSVLVPSPAWFMLGVGLLTGVLLIQSVQSLVWRSLLASPYADPQLTALLFNVPASREQEHQEQPTAHESPAIEHRSASHPDSPPPVRDS